MDVSIDEASSKIAGVHLSDRPMKDITNTSMNEEADERKMEKYTEYLSRAKKYIGQGQIEKALILNKKALKLQHSDKLAKKIRKMEEYLKEHAGESEEEEDNGMMHLGKGFYLFKDLHSKLYAHQQAGVLWMWSLFRRKKGGILGDDMGLGKTIQVIAFLSGLFDMQMVHSVLIVLPVALMVNWEKELNKWAPGLKVVAYHGSSKREKERALARVQKRGGICLTTYGLVVTSWEALGNKEGREFVWDYMILDEGHKIKNPTKTSKGVHNIPATHRLILTGTPVQNNLKELWALFDFVHQGSLLGTQRTFKLEYDTPITRAREKDATSGEKILGMQMAESLKNIIAPYFLRRTKAEVKQSEHQFKKELAEGMEGDVKHAVMPTMTRKNDLIVWTFLQDAQLKIYQDFLSLDSVKELLMTAKSPLVALNVLKKICDHPRLLSTRACAQLGIEDEHLDDDFLETEASNESAVTRIAHIADNLLINESGKLLFLVQLLDRLKVEGHRCLVFSQSRKMLDIMQKVLTNKGHKIMRLDGTITQVQDRETRIQKFQTDSSYNVFLLTTQVGGVGLTLTAANRVVIFDPSWNPATDAQAVDRAFRIGQDKNVVIYRLITCGTVEEKIYRRQVFKDSITRQTTGNAKNPYRYFSKYELRELFTLDDPHSSSTQQQLEQLHSGQRLTDPSLDEHIAFLYSLEMFGLSDHDLMFTQGSEGGDQQDEEEESEQQGPDNDYILHRVQKAQELLRMESSQAGTLEERLGKAPGVSTGAMAGLGNHRNQFNNWNFPKPMLQQELEDQVKREREQQERGVTVIEDGDEDEEADENEDDQELDNVKPINTSPATVDLTQMESPARNIKQEPTNIKQEPINIKQEPRELGQSPVQVKKEPSSFDTHMIDLTSPVIVKREPLEVSTPNVSEEPNQSATSIGSASSLGGRSNILVQDSPMDNISRNNFKTNVQDTPEGSLGRGRHSNNSNSVDENVDDSAFDDGVIEDSVIIEDSMSESEIEEEMGNDMRGLLEKSLCQNVQEMNNTETESPILRRPVRKSISARRNVLESSDEDEENDGDVVEELDGDDDGGEEDDENSDDEKLENASRAAGVLKVGGEADGEVEKKENSQIISRAAEELEMDDDELKEEEDLMQNEANRSCLNAGNRSRVIDNAVIGGIRQIDGNISSENGEARRQREESMHVDLDHMDGEDGHGVELNGSRSVEHEVEDEQNENGHGEDMQEGEEAEEEEEETGSEEEEEELDFHSLSEEEQHKYNELVENGRLCCQQKRYEEGQAHVLQALEIFPDPELQATAMIIQRKIIKQQQRMQQH